MGNSEKVKIIIYIEIGLYVLSLIRILLGIIFAGTVEKDVLDLFKPEERHDVRELIRTSFIVFLVFIGITMVISLILIIVLYKGHQQRSAGKLKVWFVLGCIGVFLTSLSIMLLVMNPEVFVYIIPEIISVIYRIWSLFVVKAFINEIQAGPQHPPFQAVQYSHA